MTVEAAMEQTMEWVTAKHTNMPWAACMALRVVVVACMRCAPCKAVHMPHVSQCHWSWLKWSSLFDGCDSSIR